MAKSTVSINDLASHKGLFILQGIVLLVFGWLILSRPVGTILSLVEILGLFWVIGGIIDILLAFVGKNGHRALRLLGGLVGLIAGIIVLNHVLLAGFITTTFVVYIIAFSFIFNGITRLIMGSKKANGKYKWSMGSLILGILYFILGLAILGAPLIISLATLVFVTGWIAVVNGIVSIVLPFVFKD